MLIIAASSDPYYPKHDDFLMVNHLRDKFKLIRWDLSELFGMGDFIVSGRVESAIRIHSVSDLEKQLDSLNEPCIMISCMLFSCYCRIAGLLKKYNVKFFYVAKEDLSAWIHYEMLRHNLFEVGFRISNLRQICHCYRLTGTLINILKYKGIKFDYVIGSHNFFPENNKQFLKVHHVAYEDFINGKSSLPIVEGKYILFIDCGFAHHPDYTGKHNSIDESKYTKLMNAYFDYLEEVFQMPVVVSLHPKTNYSEEAFGGRTTYIYKTQALVEHSTFVVSHFSTSMYHAVLCKKPIAVLSSGILLESSAGYTLRDGMFLGKILHADVVDIEKKELPKFRIDKKRYIDFTEKFLVNKSLKNKSNADIVTDFFAGLEHT